MSTGRSLIAATSFAVSVEPALRIAVAALNPHASDSGLFGDEEARIIEPAVNAARSEGIDVSGPWPADTLFVRARRGKQFVAAAVPYAEFPQRTFVNHGNEVYLGNDQFIPFDPDESPVDGETLVSVLNAVKEVMNRRQQGT